MALAPKEAYIRFLEEELLRKSFELNTLQNDYLRYIFGNFDVNAGWGRELWLCCWMVAILQDNAKLWRESYHVAKYVVDGGWGRELWLAIWMEAMMQEAVTARGTLREMQNQIRWDRTVHGYINKEVF